MTESSLKKKLKGTVSGPVTFEFDLLHDDSKWAVGSMILEF